MSWLAPSLDDVDTDADADKQCDVVPNIPSTSPQNEGVQEDLDILKQTLTPQLRGVASFLPPPPTNSLPSSPPHRHTQSDPTAPFTCNQSHPPNRCLSENGQQSEAPQIRTHSSNIDEASFKTMSPEASATNMNFISFGSESVGNEESEMEDYNFQGAVGITDEVLTFAMNISMHPETWLDFPIDEEDDTDDFDMSDAQQEHALAIEILAPRLNKQDAGVLSTPQVMAARAMWMEELHKQKMKLQSDWFGRSTSYSGDRVHHNEYFSPRLFANTYFGDMPHGTEKADYDTEKHTVESSETHFIDKSVIEESPGIKTEDKDLIRCRSAKFILQEYEDDEDDEWPEDSCDGIIIPVVDAEDISFSDLENDDFVLTPIKSKTESKAI
ncbi:BSD domain protein [Senna tora]|uniref:BSD domain protein n=1 Tax=Senna tora TaxID=362788 RepID=A0A834T926_9FABA|nr:BSD domain protein [Senna tora]